MASVVYNEFKRGVAAGEYDMDAANNKWVALLMTNTTADTEEDVTAVGSFTTLDECDGSGYVRKKLASVAVAADTTNDRAEFDADDVVWSALGNGTRDIQGVLLYWDADDDGDSADDALNAPIAFIDFTTDQSPGGSDLTVSWDAQGILQLT